MSNELPKHLIVSMREIQSLIKAEWSVIRTYQKLVNEEWRVTKRIRRFPEECCGVLFFNSCAFASNGHFILKIKTDGPSVDPNVKYFFYDYLQDEVIENYNPFLEFVNIGINDLLYFFKEWKPYNIKVRVEDLKNIIEGNVKNVRHRRDIAFHAGYDSERSELGIRLEDKKGSSNLVRIPVYAFPFQGFPEFSVNLSYFHKILDIMAPWYHVIELCFSGLPNHAITIKAKNPAIPDKPDIRAILGQFILI